MRTIFCCGLNKRFGLKFLQGRPPIDDIQLKKVKDDNTNKDEDMN